MGDLQPLSEGLKTRHLAGDGARTNTLARCLGEKKRGGGVSKTSPRVVSGSVGCDYYGTTS